MKLSKDRSLTFQEDAYIVSLLNAAGFYVDSIFTLLNTSASYPEAIPVLISIIEKEQISSDWMLEVVVRTLTVIEAKGLAAPVLINLYHKLSIEYESLRWAVGNAMTKVMTDSDITEVLSIVKNPDNGTSRQMFVYALAKFKKWKPTIEPVLIPLLEQDDVRGHTIYTLGHLQSQTARAKIETFVNHPITYIRKEARKALERIDKPLKK